MATALGLGLLKSAHSLTCTLGMLTRQGFSHIVERGLLKGGGGGGGMYLYLYGGNQFQGLDIGYALLINRKAV